MPKEPTPRLGLKNPSTGEFDWDVSWWDNMDIIDEYPGIIVSTTATLPVTPWVGQHVFNMDSLSMLTWNGSIWVNQSSGVFDHVKAGPGGVNWGDVVYLDSNGLLQKAGNDLAEEYAFRVIGIVLRNLLEGEEGLVKKSGLLRNPGWTLIRGQEYYLGTGGNIVDTQPETGFVQNIGVALEPDALSIRISSPYVSLANIDVIQNNITSNEGDILDIENGTTIVPKASNADTLDNKHYADIQADLDSKASDTDLTNHTGNTDNPHIVVASQVNFDNTASGLTANLVQSALDELDTDFNLHKAKFADNAGAHNSIYRGKYLGSSVTVAQYSEISGGTFEDLYIGDYWTIGGVDYRIAGFNYYYNAGDVALTENHITLVPDTTLYNYVMNDTNITDGGYAGSKMYTLGLDQAKTTIQTAFSSHLVNHRNYLCNAVSTEEASGGAWFDSTVELMNEIMVYGSIVDGHATYGLYNIGVEKIQLPLFALRPDIANIRSTYWLQDVASGACFAGVGNRGGAYHGTASYALGVRPAFSIS